jgi:CheY-like chemotaxis protein
VLGIVEQSGGAIDVDSAPGEGTTCRIYLPAVGSADGDVPSTEDPNPTVLLTEDDDGLRELSALVLDGEGYRVLQARTGAEALELATSNEVDLLLTDVIMPHMNGPKLAEELRRRWPGLPVIFMTGYAEETVFARTGIAREERVLRKPFLPDDLIDHVERALVRDS